MADAPFDEGDADTPSGRAKWRWGNLLKVGGAVAAVALTIAVLRWVF